MRCFVGLGNPGAAYQTTRHNFGQMAVDAIHRAYQFPPWQEKFASFISAGIIAGHKVLLVCPQTYMNLSGRAVQQVMQFYKLPLADILVFHDDLDLPVGKVRLKTGGGSGGNNGLKSIDAAVGADYPRVRLGIDRPIHKGQVSDYVLQPFDTVQIQIVDKMLPLIAMQIPLILENRGDLFLNKLATEG